MVERCEVVVPVEGTGEELRHVSEGNQLLCMQGTFMQKGRRALLDVSPVAHQVADSTAATRFNGLTDGLPAPPFLRGYSLHVSELLGPASFRVWAMHGASIRPVHLALRATVAFLQSANISVEQELIHRGGSMEFVDSRIPEVRTRATAHAEGIIYQGIPAFSLALASMRACIAASRGISSKGAITIRLNGRPWSHPPIA